MNGTVELTLPKDVNVTDAEIRMISAARLFDMGELSSGQAAKLVGITRREFWDQLEDTAYRSFNTMPTSWKKISRD